MSNHSLYPVSVEWSKNAKINAEHYQIMYQQSLDDPNAFWAIQAQQYLSWFKPWTHVLTGDFPSANCRWFEGAQLNVCYNAVDRHLVTRANQVALIWEGNEPGDARSFTYQQLHDEVCRFALLLKQQRVQKGDRVCIYLPMIPEAVFAMLACARIGAIHSVVFAGFSPEALKMRIQDAGCTLLITSDEGVRGDKRVPLKANVDKALLDCPKVDCVVVIQRTGADVAWDDTRDVHYHHALKHLSSIDCPIEPMDATDPLFILYTSGSTGKPKGIVHSTGGYALFAAITHDLVFDRQEGDVYWCTADLGWITGHSYLVYGPLINGGTTLLFEGVPHYPSYARYWEIIDKYQVNVFYTAPTAIRALRHEGDDWVRQTSRQSLRLLGSVGEPINPDAWMWYYQVVGEERCPIVNTWWQTETGGVLLTALPGATPLAPGSVGVPFFGIEPMIFDDDDHLAQCTHPGRLMIKKPWPGLMQTIYGDPARYKQSYFNVCAGYYATGDGALWDEDQQIWITGRNDDVIKVSGHRLGTEELESALVSHRAVSEAGVVGIPHEIKGESIVAFVSLNRGEEGSDALKTELIAHVRDQIGPLATIERIQWAQALPKTRSGKIMRRILRHIANPHKKGHDMGDISTLADASVVAELMK